MEIIYVYFKSSHGDIYDCTSCGSEAPLHKFKGSHRELEARYLCELCSDTMVGIYTEYATSDRDLDLYRAMTKQNNIVIDKCTGRDRFKQDAIIIPSENEE